MNSPTTIIRSCHYCGEDTTLGATCGLFLCGDCLAREEYDVWVEQNLDPEPPAA